MINSLKSPKFGTKFTFHTGISGNNITELISYTQRENDPAVHTSTKDWQGGRGRFASRENFDRWLTQGRDVYTLLDEQGILAGILWLGERSIPTKGYQFPPGFKPTQYRLTLGIRLYGAARGAGLSAGFVRLALKDYFAKNPQAKIWLETNVTNLASQALSKKLGAKPVTISEDGQRIILVLDQVS